MRLSKSTSCSPWYRSVAATGTELHLDWAIPAFRLVHSTVAPNTQIHTCVANLQISSISTAWMRTLFQQQAVQTLKSLDELKAASNRSGPGVYDIPPHCAKRRRNRLHTIEAILAKFQKAESLDQPDCGFLKNTWYSRNKESLITLAEAAKQLDKN